MSRRSHLLAPHRLWPAFPALFLVLTLAFLATTRSGQSYVVTVLAENTSQPIDQASAIPAILAAVKGAFTLAAKG